MIDTEMQDLIGRDYLHGFTPQEEAIYVNGFRDGRDSLAKRIDWLEKIMGYAAHNGGCSLELDYAAGICDCGLVELLERD